MKWDQILIASDIDGTLLPGGREIPERNLSALRRFAEKGGRFTLATGRSIGSAGQFLDRLPVNAPAICLNGALLYDYKQQKVLESCPL
ncbi:MAG TPA: HAD-IIB family hydrolase, partial [Candidatus Caccousia stercoris]|nr:HAD-IIB family hydrolase [Candidatus Caccousia stercoris]